MHEGQPVRLPEGVELKTDKFGNRTMFASRDYEVDEVVLKSTFSLVKVKKEFVDKYCSQCLEPEPSYECPGACKYLKYCNVGCAEEHRAIHKHECFEKLSLVPERVRFVSLAMLAGPEN